MNVEVNEWIDATTGVTVERSGGVVTVTFDRPHRKNAVTPDGGLALRDGLRSVVSPTGFWPSRAPVRTSARALTSDKPATRLRARWNACGSGGCGHGALRLAQEGLHHVLVGIASQTQG
jgi:hypothetical protein